MSGVRVGVMGDSHCQSAADLDESVTEALAGCEYIVHLGDVSAADVLDRLERIAPVIGVTSETDPADARLVGTARALDVAGRTVAIRRSLAGDEMFGEEVDVVVHGGTHDHSIELRAGKLFVNPGSTRWATRRPTLVILDLSDEGIGVEVVGVKDG
ncbi:MAG TPA: metallophosphoesterase family protein [Acidimicrobiales bacterium]|nr:metallophosphoesterase family protein [Acidimicrobiales bacterium]